MEEAAVEWIEITRLCEKFHVMPYQGGLLQQPSWVYRRLKAVSIVDQQLQELELKTQEAKAKQAQIGHIGT